MADLLGFAESILLYWQRGQRTPGPVSMQYASPEPGKLSHNKSGKRY